MALPGRGRPVGGTIPSPRSPRRQGHRCPNRRAELADVPGGAVSGADGGRDLPHPRPDGGVLRLPRGATPVGRSREALAEDPDPSRRCACTCSSESGMTRSPISTLSRDGCPGCSGTCSGSITLTSIPLARRSWNRWARGSRRWGYCTWVAEAAPWAAVRGSGRGPAGSNGGLPGRGIVEGGGRRGPRRGAVSPARDGTDLGGGAQPRLSTFCARGPSRELGGAGRIVQQHLERALAISRRAGSRARRAAVPSARHAVGDEDRARSQPISVATPGASPRSAWRGS